MHSSVWIAILNIKLPRMPRKSPVEFLNLKADPVWLTDPT